MTILNTHEYCEVLEINKLRTRIKKDQTFRVLNRDNNDCFITSNGKRLFIKMGNHAENKFCILVYYNICTNKI